MGAKLVRNDYRHPLFIMSRDDPAYRGNLWMDWRHAGNLIGHDYPYLESFEALEAGSAQ
jgi:hypothetical protein